MAATCTAFYAEIIGFPNPDRGLMAGANYKLSQGYLSGMADANAKANAKGHAKQNAALAANGKQASFDAIAGP